MIFPDFRRSSEHRNVHALYGTIVAQARSAVFYTGYGVADTVEGRFELLVLHVVLVLRRLSRADKFAARLDPGPTERGLIGQRLFDVFCHDLDRNLREMGVGDLAVPREMRRFGEAFYGRQTAYRAGFDAAGQQGLEAAIARNIYGVAAVDQRAARLALYARAAAGRLDRIEASALAAGKAKMSFPSLRLLRMPERKSEKQAPAGWRVPVAVDDVAETGQRFDLVADAEVRAAVARMAGLRDLPRLQANFEMRRHGAGGLHVSGVVSATVGQSCVVTLEPLLNEIAEEVDLLFVPALSAAQERGESDSIRHTWDEPEPLIGGQVDLGALATEFLILALDPYPRKAGAMFEPPQNTKPDEGSFAALAALKKDADGR